MTDYARLIRDVPDFPKPGIVFKDITPMLGDAAAFGAVIRALAAPFEGLHVDAVAGIESRGFIFGAALAREIGAGFLPVRKPGKLPARTLGIDYALEYGSDRLEIHADALQPSARVLLVDDVLATGGTLVAAHGLLGLLGAEIVGAALVVELDFLGGRRRWPAHVPLHVLLHY